MSAFMSRIFFLQINEIKRVFTRCTRYLDFKWSKNREIFIYE